MSKPGSAAGNRTSSKLLASAVKQQLSTLSTIKLPKGRSETKVKGSLPTIHKPKPINSTFVTKSSAVTRSQNQLIAKGNGGGSPKPSLSATAKFTSVLGKSLRVEPKPANKRVRPSSSAKKPANKTNTALQESSKQQMGVSAHKNTQSIKTAT